MVAALCWPISLCGQTHQILLDATVNPDSKVISIQQEIVYYNTSNDVLEEIMLLDWANSFSDKTSALGVRFAENFNSGFHFEKDKNRGRTEIESIQFKGVGTAGWERPEVDLIRVKLNSPLAPGMSKTLKLVYSVKIPSDKFTRFGYDNQDNISLRYWFIAPAVYKNGWQHYSNKNLDDLYLDPSHFDINLKVPPTYNVVTDLTVVSEQNTARIKNVVLTGEDRNHATLYLTKRYDFQSVLTDTFEVITNLDDNDISPPLKALNIDRIVHFLREYVGEYPFEKMVVSVQDYKQNPVYGLNQLPDFVRPFPDGFKYDIEQFKTITAKYLKHTLRLDPRRDHWLYGAIQVYLMMKYTDMFYPDMKIIGSLSNLWIIKWSHASNLEFNDQYPLLYMNMARNNLEQSLSTSRDSLLKFNRNIAASYKAGIGFRYLDEYLQSDAVSQSIKEFYQAKRLKESSSEDFKNTLKSKTDLPVDWFFDQYVGTIKKIDFTIKQVKKVGDSLLVTIKNKRDNAMPVSLFGLNKDEVVYKTWVKEVDSIAKVTIPAKDITKLAVNYDKVIPEINNRNNFKTVGGLLNRPMQFRLFLDVEDPDYNQVFFMPVFDYNFYDGLSIGPKMYNKTVLPKPWSYKIEPKFGIKSKQIVGSASVVYTQNVENNNLFAVRYGFSGSSKSYNEGLNYKRYTPFLTFAFRDHTDLRKNKRQFISLRNINVDRDEDPLIPLESPNYSVFNLTYSYQDNNLIDFYKGVMSYEISSKFSKISTTLEYRKLFLNNRQLNLRFFGGLFLFNDTRADDDFFSFALDRPTDYLFDYNYYGRSEDAGVFSQQIIIAEGGFKSQLQPAFANSWIATVNASTNIWKWIYAYGDAGLVHNSNLGTKAVYDTGVRLSLVADYFELFFPLYSNNGWEPGLPNYDQRIRFIVTLSPSTLFKLFTREWY